MIIKENHILWTYNFTYIEYLPIIYLTIDKLGVSLYNSHNNYLVISYYNKLANISINTPRPTKYSTYFCTYYVFGKYNNNGFILYPWFM